MDLTTLNHASPSAFYLPHGSLEELSDCCAVIDGVSLPLHSHVLSVHSSVLRELFRAQQEGGGLMAGPSPRQDRAPRRSVDLSAAFEGSSVEDAACLLRLLYAPQEAGGPAFKALLEAGRLPAVAGLAHKLDVPFLLSALETHLQGVCLSPSMDHLLAGLQVAQRCCFEGLETKLLEAAGNMLAATGKDVSELVKQESLAPLGTATVVQLLLSVTQHVQGGFYRPPPLLEAREGSSSGGMTFALCDFSKEEGKCCSPWAVVGGIPWRLNVHPKGVHEGQNTHLSVFLQWNRDAAKAAGVKSAKADFTITILDQQESKHDMLYSVNKPYEFTRSNKNCGRRRLISLDALRAPSRAYLAHDRLLVRADIAILSIQRTKRSAPE